MKTTLHELAAKLCEKWREKNRKLNSIADEVIYRNDCARCAAELEAALAEAPAAGQQWQDISTAPKDGSFIVWDATENRSAICEMQKWANGHVMPTEHGGYLMPNPILWTAAPTPPKP